MDLPLRASIRTSFPAQYSAKQGHEKLSTAAVERGPSEFSISLEETGKPSFTARILPIPYFYLRVAESILECARRTSTFRACAFREQEDDQATLPSPLAVLRPTPYTIIFAIQPGLNSPARSSIN